MKRILLSRSAAAFALILLVLFNTGILEAAPRRIAPGDEGYIVRTGVDELKVMSYNVENLFDNVDDTDKDDATFLPLSAPGKKAGCQKEKDNYKAACLKTDWTDARVQLKLMQIRRVMEAQGDLPDAMILVEMENENILRQLAAVLGYRNYKITNGPDRRGIDVAILWRPEKLAYVGHKEIEIRGQATRPIFKVLFRVAPSHRGMKPGELVVFGNHWPSQAAPPKIRTVVARILRAEMERDIAQLGEDRYHAIVMGDLNTREEERPNALSDVLTTPDWRHALSDAHELSDRSSNPMNGVMPPGTYYFSPDGWRRFDRILITKSLSDGSGMDILPETLRVIAPSFMLTGNDRDRHPMRYNFYATNPNQAGFSDHLPVVVKLRLP